MIGPGDLKKLKKMGIDADIIQANNVVIELKDKRIIIEGSTVMKATVSGNTFFSVYGGRIREESLTQTDKKETQGSLQVSQEDVKFVMEQTGKTEQQVRDALTKSNGDIAKAIETLLQDSG